MRIILSSLIIFVLISFDVRAQDTYRGRLDVNSQATLGGHLYKQLSLDVPVHAGSLTATLVSTDFDPILLAVIPSGFIVSASLKGILQLTKLKESSVNLVITSY